ncbi:hypothetical protein F2Q70_00011776 [Brassica cretica]|uniref:Uncharacterized protein n=1 Tax=Brassica cretica TaxID=69181 RepID=A0A8S9M7B2_BRACR|nr:hypothetical protein F2Q70_00011776 [Brassica cretica]
MEGSPYQKFSFSRMKGVVPGSGSGVRLSGDPGSLLAGTQRPVSCLGSGGIQYLSFPYAGHRSSRDLVVSPRTADFLLKMTKLRAFGGALEMMEPGDLMISEEET